MSADAEARGGKATGATGLSPLFATALVLLVFAASRCAIAGIPSEREYDEGVYLLSAREMLAGHGLFSSVFSSQPPAFLESLALAMRVFGDSLLTGRLLILGFALVALAAVASLARRLAGSWAAPAAAAAMALTTTFGDLAHMVEAEMPALAAALLALCACLESRHRGWHRGWLLASGALLALGVLFKVLVAPMAAPLGLLLLLAPARDDETNWRFDGRGLDLIGRVAARSVVVAAGALPVLILPLLVYDTAALYEQTIAFHFAKRDAYHFSETANLWRVVHALHTNAAVAATALLGIALLLLRDRLAALWLIAWMLVMLATITAQSPLFWRHFVLLLPPLALAAGAAVPLLSARLRNSAPLLLTIAMVALWAVSTMTGQGRRREPVLPIGEDSDRGEYSTLLLENAALWIRQNTTPLERVAGDDPIAIYLADRRSPPGLCDTSTARILSKSLTLEEATRESSVARVIVLRAEGRLSRMKGYLDWLEEHYDKQPPEQTGVIAYRSVWIRKSGVAPDPGTTTPR